MSGVGRRGGWGLGGGEGEDEAPAGGILRIVVKCWSSVLWS